MDGFWSAITTGVIDSLVFAALVYLLQMYRYRQHLSSKFNNKTFLTYYKGNPNEIVQTVKLTVKQNVIHFKGVRQSDNDPFEGQLVMNPINLKTGDGFQYHTKNEEGYGFVKAIVKDDNTVLVEAPFVKPADKEEARVKPQAFIWRRKK